MEGVFSEYLFSKPLRFFTATFFYEAIDSRCELYMLCRCLWSVFLSLVYIFPFLLSLSLWCSVHMIMIMYTYTLYKDMTATTVSIYNCVHNL